MRRKLAAIAVLCLLLVAGSFAWLHSGAAGDAACKRSWFVPSDGISAWPQGARCNYGEPLRSDVVLHPWFVVIACVLVVLGAVAMNRTAGLRHRRGDRLPGAATRSARREQR